MFEGMGNYVFGYNDSCMFSMTALCLLRPEYGTNNLWPTTVECQNVCLVILQGGRVLEWSDSVCNKSPYCQLVHLLCAVVRRPC